MPAKKASTRSEAQRAAEKKYNEKRASRYRCYTEIFYPDSAPDDWEDRLSDLHLQIWVSPIHDGDVWTKKDVERDKRRKVGGKKKPHYHLVVEYPSPVTPEAFKEDFEFLNGVEGQRVKDKNAIVRYLVHKDDPKKAQYDPADMRVFGGADLSPLEALGIAERHEALKLMRAFIKDNNVTEFCLFYDYCDDCQTQWAHLLDDSCSYTIERYIKSLRAMSREGSK